MAPVSPPREVVFAATRRRVSQTRRNVQGTQQVPAMAGGMTTITTDGREPEDYMLTVAQFAELQRSFRGALIDKEHVSYDVARRVWNGNIDRRPALVARCTGVADVQCAVN